MENRLGDMPVAPGQREWREYSPVRSTACTEACRCQPWPARSDGADSPPALGPSDSPPSLPRVLPRLFAPLYCRRRVNLDHA